MRDLLLNPETHDLVISGRDVSTVNDPAAIVQNIRQRLLHFTQEWFLDLASGTPWWEEILVKGQRQYIVEDILKTRIRETPGVTDLTGFELAQSGERGISVSFIATTVTGAEIDEIVRLAI
ncbi:MAG: putative baseplate wedge protein [Prokaryotic dsDNA virus sp.]|nr:MAG: putative baseplate wedge protein [Prokaryotic dsDNA virus sp.]|tara:strand:- start:2484 stop:2846 length:363 start_codon:yes stop_codon:yes gene_type:complete